MASSADALQSAGHAGRRLDLDDEVDRTHINAEFEARGGDDGREAPALEVVLDDAALLAAHRSVVGPREWQLHLALFGQVVEPAGEPLGEAAGVGEHQRGALLRDEVDDALLDIRPDGGTPRIGGCGSVDVEFGPHRCHVGHRHDDREVPVLVCGRVHDGNVGTRSQETGHRFHWTHGCRQANALRGLRRELVEALEAECQVGSALGARERVDLVDDDGVDGAQRLARLRSEHEEE